MLLNLYQNAVMRSFIHGHNVAWVTNRQAGKTTVAHEVINLLPSRSSVAYVCPSERMAAYTKSRFPRNNFVTYLSAMHTYHDYKGSALVIVDEFDMIRDVDFLHDIARGNYRKLFLGTIWPHYMDDRLEKVNPQVLTDTERRALELNRLAQGLLRNNFDYYQG